MKLTLTFFVFLLTFGMLHARQVDQNTAMIVGKSFLTNQTSSSKFQNGVTLTLASTIGSGAIGNNKPADPQTYAYIFNINATEGFVIVSAYDNALPILGYSDEKAFSTTKFSHEAALWFNYYKKQIKYAVDNNITANAAIQTEWTDLIAGISYTPASPLRGSRSVTPLLGGIVYDQSPYYNDQCPYDTAAAKHCVTGCPATAMAQIIRYHHYPTQGTGIGNYNDVLHGSQTANFGATTYNYANMPDSLAGPNADVAQLMYHCGVAVHMGYTSEESGAYVIASDDTFCSQNAYVTFFGYNPATIRGLHKDDFSDSAWIAMLEGDLTAGNPIQYAGFGPGGGHTWVCDGFDQNDFFHMNWGWSGYDDAYYAITALAPGVGGIGAGDGNFNSNQEACMGIVPLSSGVTLPKDLQLNSAISVNPSPINFLGAFTVNADVINNTTTAFSGDFAAMLFNAEGDFITMIDSFSTGPTPLGVGANFTGGITFTNLGLLTVPGNYTIAIDYRATGGNWYQVGSTNFTNPVTVAIASTYDSINLYSNIAPGTSTFLQGHPGTVTVNLTNSGTSAYTGTYQALLIDVNTGIIAQVLGSYTESAGLAAGGHYTTPLTFTCPAVTATPGTYILGIAEQAAVGAAPQYYVGGGSYTNPVNIDVVAAPIQPDPYEHDDSVAQAHAFAVTFANNADSIATTGSNIHNVNDVDYYMLTLPAGGSYSIDATLYDQSNAAGAQTFTLPALTSFSIDNGATWSATYSGGTVPTIAMPNGGTIYFSGAPYFPGQVGTYQLSFKIAQLRGVGINNTAADAAFAIYPNPTSNNITVRTDGSANTLTLCDIEGRVVMTTGLTQSETQIDLSAMSKGLYIVKIANGTHTISSKLIIE